MAKTVKFLSLKYRMLRVVIDAKCMKEVQGRLVASSLNGIFPAGYVAEFKDGEFNTADETVIEALKANPYYGATFVLASELEAGDVKIGDEGQRMLNEKKVVAGELASTCPKCGFKAKNEAGLLIHMRSHQDKA